MGRGSARGLAACCCMVLVAAAATGANAEAFRSGPQSRGGMDRAMRDCMMGRMPDGVASVSASMETFDRANPRAGEEERRATKRAAMRSWAESHRQEFAEAKKACGGM